MAASSVLLQWWFAVSPWMCRVVFKDFCGCAVSSLNRKCVAACCDLHPSADLLTHRARSVGGFPSTHRLRFKHTRWVDPSNTHTFKSVYLSVLILIWRRSLASVWRVAAHHVLRLTIINQSDGATCHHLNSPISEWAVGPCDLMFTAVCVCLFFRIRSDHHHGVSRPGQEDHLGAEVTQQRHHHQWRGNTVRSCDHSEVTWPQWGPK